MTPAIGRLKKRPEFLRVANRGRKWVAPGLVLQACPRRPGGEPDGPEPDRPAAREIRYGLTASRKVGGAVLRNRARRRLRSAATAVLPEAGRPGTDYVLIARAGTVRRPYRELVRDLRVALERVATAKPRSRREGR